MKKLAEYLQAQLSERHWSLRTAEEQTGIPRETLGRLVRGEERSPRLDTLEQIALGFDIPLWRVVELCGYNVGLSSSPNNQARRLTALTDSLPQFQPVVDHLLELNPTDLEAILIYLEALQRRRALHADPG